MSTLGKTLSTQLPPGMTVAPPKDESDLATRTQGWKDYLGDPQVQAALLQMGTMLMQPMPITQTDAGALGQAVQGGAAAAGRTQTAMEAEQQRQFENVQKQEATAQRGRQVTVQEQGLKLEQQKLPLEQRRVAAQEAQVATQKQQVEFETSPEQLAIKQQQARAQSQQAAASMQQAQASMMNARTEQERSAAYREYQLAAAALAAANAEEAQARAGLINARTKAGIFDTTGKNPNEIIAQFYVKARDAWLNDPNNFGREFTEADRARLTQEAIDSYAQISGATGPMAAGMGGMPVPTTPQAAQPGLGGGGAVPSAGIPPELKQSLTAQGLTPLENAPVVRTIRGVTGNSLKVQDSNGNVSYIRVP